MTIDPVRGFRPLHWVLLLSLALNAALIWLYLAKRDQAVTQQVLQRQAVGTALECSKGTEQLAGAAKARQAAAAPLVAAAAGTARKLESQSQEILAEAPAPGADACTRAQASVAAWWTERSGR